MRERKKRETSFIILKLDDDDDDRNDITINEILSAFCLVLWFVISAIKRLIGCRKLV